MIILTKSIYYDVASYCLYIKDVGVYIGVPVNVIEDWIDTNNKYKYFNEKIRNRYCFEKKQHLSKLAG
jgi:hypothetical protein